MIMKGNATVKIVLKCWLSCK